jgi:hypothetical protein
MLVTRNCSHQLELHIFRVKFHLNVTVILIHINCEIDYCTDARKNAYGTWSLMRVWMGTSQRTTWGAVAVWVMQTLLLKMTGRVSTTRYQVLVD